MKGCVGPFLAWIAQLWIRSFNYLNDKDQLASLYYDNVYIIESVANLCFCFFMFIFWHQIYIYTSVPFKLIFGKDGKFHLIQFVCFALKKNYSGVPLLVCVTVVVSLKWLAVPIMTSQSKTTAKEFLKPSYNVQRESLDMTNKSQKF